MNTVDPASLVPTYQNTTGGLFSSNGTFDLEGAIAASNGGGSQSEFLPPMVNVPGTSMKVNPLLLLLAGILVWYLFLRK